MTNTKIGCHSLLPYMLGELSEKETREFEQHMTTCVSCQQDCETMWHTHELLLTEEGSPTERDAMLSRIRESTILAAFSARPPKKNLHPRHASQARWHLFASNRLKRSFTLLRPRFMYGVAALLVGVAVGVAGVDMGIFPSSKQPGALIAQLDMHPNTAYRKSSAMAWIVRQNRNYNLMVYAKDLPQQSPWGCYDVWVVSGSKQYSVAEFTVTGRGIGAVSAVIPSNMQFSAIEITLEPHWNDPVPQGPLVLHAQVGNV
ncbi:MAG: anti-sigma factor domain-containing protein [Bacilli bacterium]